MSTNIARNNVPQGQPAKDQQGPRSTTTTKSKKKNRNRKRRNRRQSFVASEDAGPTADDNNGGLVRTNPEQGPERVSFYRGRNLSNTSLESEALLDHR